MSEYRLRDTGEILSEGRIRKMYPNTSFPKIWNSDIFNFLRIDPILKITKPEPSSKYKVIVRDGTVQDENGNWVENYIEKNMFDDYTDIETGQVITREEQELNYQNKLDSEKAREIRAKRDKLLEETDWIVVKAKETSTNISSSWKTYRQALRDITDHANFPYLNDSDFPTKPQ